MFDKDRVSETSTGDGDTSSAYPPTPRAIIDSRRRELGDKKLPYRSSGLTAMPEQLSSSITHSWSVSSGVVVHFGLEQTKWAICPSQAMLTRDTNFGNAVLYLTHCSLTREVWKGY